MRKKYSNVFFRVNKTVKKASTSKTMSNNETPKKVRTVAERKIYYNGDLPNRNVQEQVRSMS